VRADAPIVGDPDGGTEEVRVATGSHVARHGAAAHHVLASLVAGVAVATAWVGTALALEAADGVSRVRGGPDRSEYQTEFIESWMYETTAVLAILVLAGAAWLSWSWAAVGLGGVVSALWWGGSTTVQRYAESGWSDGLEVFVFIVPIAAGVLGVVVVLVCSSAGRRRRRARREETLIVR
jgi:hypothetical protein